MCASILSNNTYAFFERIRIVFSPTEHSVKPMKPVFKNKPHLGVENNHRNALLIHGFDAVLHTTSRQLSERCNFQGTPSTLHLSLVLESFRRGSGGLEILDGPDTMGEFATFRPLQWLS